MTRVSLLLSYRAHLLIKRKFMLRHCWLEFLYGCEQGMENFIKKILKLYKKMKIIEKFSTFCLNFKVSIPRFFISLYHKDPCGLQERDEKMSFLFYEKIERDMKSVSV